MAYSLTATEQLFSSIVHYSDSLSENKRILNSLSDLEILELYHDSIRSLMDALTAANLSVLGHDPHENPGLYDIIETANKCANEITDIVEEAQQHILLAGAIDSAAASRAPLNRRPAVQYTQNLLDEQGENFEITVFCDRYKMQMRDLPQGDFTGKFDSIMAFYMSIAGKAFSSPSAVQQFTQLVQQIKTDLEDCVKKQREIEAAVLAQTENVNAAMADQNTERTALVNFQTALKQNQAEMIDEGFKALTDEQKEAVRVLLGQKLNRNIPGTMFNFVFSKWPGKHDNYKAQKETVAELIGHNAPMENSAPRIELFAEEMAGQLAQIFAVQQPQPETLANPRLTNIQNAFLILEEVVKKDTLPLDGFNMNFTMLNSLDVNCCFKLCNFDEYEAINITNRLCFHLFHIHKIERREMQEDIDYGRKALLELEENYTSTHDERIRLLKRTMAEVALAGLEEAIDNDDMDFIRLFIDGLYLSLHPLDAVNVENKVAYRLSNHLYLIYKEAYERNSALPDPHDGRFKHDFGRYGFTDPEVHPQFKKQAIYALLQELQLKWQIHS